MGFFSSSFFSFCSVVADEFYARLPFCERLWMEFLDCFETIIQSIIIPEYRFFLVKQQTIDRNQAKLERFLYTKGN